MLILFYYLVKIKFFKFNLVVNTCGDFLSRLLIFIIFNEVINKIF